MQVNNGYAPRPFQVQALRLLALMASVLVEALEKLWAVTASGACANSVVRQGLLASEASRATEVIQPSSCTLLQHLARVNSNTASTALQHPRLGSTLAPSPYDIAALCATTTATATPTRPAQSLMRAAL
ncbi:hypothetical protein PT974_08982 [Cladobotryum mycophilum]|uniref:Secreted protein n=1 Tax=Cladobotryum mycophilum TaxID=491253 RepID=A0ABR0SEW9_9HYPO